MADDSLTFEQTLAKENAHIESGRRAMGLPVAETAAEGAAHPCPPTSIVTMHRRACEPWVTHAPEDRVGLALSGGGIRSSAFTLGLLQALSDRRVLPLFDYLATVSGGGYTGGFWTSWIGANGPKEHFPGAAPMPYRDGAPSNAPLHEHPAIRHLREYSRFLAPRSGVGFVDLWEALLAVIAGMVPTALFATLLLGTCVVAWRLVVVGVKWMSVVNPWVLPIATALVAFASFVAMECRWQALRISPKPPRHQGSRATVSTAAGLTVAAVLGLATWIAVRPDSAMWEGDAMRPGIDWTWTWTTSVAHPIVGFAEIRGYLIPGGLAAGAIVIWAVRWVGSWLADWRGIAAGEPNGPMPNDPGRYGRALERASARLLLFALLTLGLAAIWELSTFLVPHDGGESDLLEMLELTGGSAAVATALFGALRHLLQPSRTDDAAGILARVRPVLPQLAALVAVLLYFTSVAIAVRLADEAFELYDITPWCFAVLPIALVLLSGSDHRGTGLHEFYRRRVSRAFVQYAGDEAPAGCDRLSPPRERSNDPAEPPPRPADRMRPVHLVCCAANSVADDPLDTLYRGARSAVVSASGVSIQDRTCVQEIRLSDALTASAAAFNSQMGSLSMRLGMAVSMLMTALNLRLGLWVRKGPGASPLDAGGVRLMTEMFGSTRTSQGWVHLSDGGHFDNTAAYELVRRHCRYIVIADCGADPKVRFDDLSTFIRLVREDFGVEIDIDVTPLVPDDKGISRQHVVVGRIFYGPRTTSDQGTLIVVKPTLTGDEPPDVTQYRARNSVFPHESTGDQFFDEPQWESYRRLGEHIGRRAFAFVDFLSPAQLLHGERVFSEAARHWHPLPVGFDEITAGLSSRCSTIESTLRTQMPESLRRELVPELATQSVVTPLDEVQQTAAYIFFLEVVQVLEDAWLLCRLDEHGQHPINQGWFAYIARWVSMPSFVRLWPLLRPVCSQGFREFVKRRFGLRFDSRSAEAGDWRTVDAELVDTAAVATVRVQNLRPTVPRKATVPEHGTQELAYRLALAGDSTGVVVGTARVVERSDEVRWMLDDVHVPARLHGSGVVGRLLDAVLARFAGKRFVVAWSADTVDRDEHDRTIALYRSRGFRVDPTGTRLERPATPAT